MASQSALVFSGIAPHPPIMVPEVGQEAVEEVDASIAGMEELTRRLISCNAETVVLISPHARLEIDAFVAYQGPELYGDFSNFRASETKFVVSVDTELLEAISQAAEEKNFRVSPIRETKVDHGTAVPLYFLLANGWHGRVVALGYSFLSNEEHLRFGGCVRQAIDHVGRRAAFIASGDLSHRLRPQAPAGYSPDAHLFDDKVVDALRSNSPEQIADIDQSVRKVAGECGYRSMLVAIGANDVLPASCEVLSYEAPFGVGYLVAQMSNASLSEVATPSEALPKLARRAVETFVRTGSHITQATRLNGPLAERAPCFVSIKTKEGDLRGCVGTIEPTKPNLAAEIAANAVSAATLDPRFPPIREPELEHLVYSVDVLLPAEEAQPEELDPKVYGVIVEDEASERRGLLLPDIPGVDDVEKQVEIAARKAGIGPAEPVRLFRFKVERFRESSAK